MNADAKVPGKPHPKRDPYVEVVLEDGRFARIRRPTVGDMATAYDPNPSLFSAKLATIITDLDGERFTLADYLHSDAELMLPITSAVAKFFQAMVANPHKGGVA